MVPKHAGERTEHAITAASSPPSAWQQSAPAIK
jgi:hypothetical protein